MCTGAIEELRGGRFALEFQAWSEAAASLRGETAAQIAGAVGRVVVRVGHLGAECPGLRLPCGVLAVREGLGATAESLVVIHEAAHEVLERSGARHTHADVWAVTVLVAARLPGCPAWARREAERLGAAEVAA